VRDFSSRVRVVLRCTAVAFLIALSFDVTVQQSHNALQRHERAGDFRGNIWEPGRDVLNSRNPYPDPASPDLKRVAVPGYPPLTFLTFLPLAMIPYVSAAFLWALLMILASLGAIAAIGVRDPVCYALVALSAPVVTSVWWGNPTPLIVLAAALAWRWRDHSLLGPAAVATAFAIKFVTWPLFVWLLLTGRIRGAARAAALAAGMIILPWASIDFDGARKYPALLQALSSVGAPKGAFIQAALLRFGLPAAITMAAGLILAVVLLAAGVRRGGDHRIYSLALIAGLASSPIVWIFYFGFVSIIIGIHRPKFSLAWLLVPALWVGNMMYFPPSPLMLALTIATTAFLVWWLLAHIPSTSPSLIVLPRPNSLKRY
jgi:hypothetical protein